MMIAAFLRYWIIKDDLRGIESLNDVVFVGTVPSTYLVYDSMPRDVKKGTYNIGTVIK